MHWSDNIWLYSRHHILIATLICELRTKLGQEGRQGPENNVIYKILKGTKIVKGSLAWGRRVDRQLFQIFEKAFDRKHIIYVLVNRAGPKV